MARTDFFKPVHVKSLPAHALRSWISARKKLVGQRVTWKTRSEAWRSCSGFRLPRALTAAFVNQALKASEGVAGLSAAMRGLIAARTAVMTAVAAIHADMRRMTDDVTTPSDRLRRNPQLIVKAISPVESLSSRAVKRSLPDHRVRRRSFQGPPSPAPGEIRSRKLPILIGVDSAAGATCKLKVKIGQS